MRVALRSSASFCPEGHTTYGVVKGRLSEGSLDVPPETIRRRRPDGARSVWISSTKPFLQIRDLPETLPRLLEHAPPDQVHAGLDDRQCTAAGGGAGRQNCTLRWLNSSTSLSQRRWKKLRGSGVLAMEPEDSVLDAQAFDALR